MTRGTPLGAAFDSLFYLQDVMLPPVEKFVTRGGARIYRIPCEAFPDLIVYAHLLIEAGPPTLVDCGSGYGESNANLLAGFATIRDEFQEPIKISDVRRIIITHGHIDHFGGLGFVREQAPAAEIAVHELDRRILTAYEERVIVASAALRHFLAQAGVRAGLQSAFMEMYSFSKRHVRSFPVDITLSDNQQLDGLRFIHTPGHCPGQVCIGVGEVLLSADHVLPIITPHLAPESITHSTGLGHYLDALVKLRGVPGFELALGGHEKAMPDVYRRIDDIRASHFRKLERILDILRAADQPLTINDVSKQLYTRVKGFHILLALEEVGAHVEYLYEHGQLSVANLDQLDQQSEPAVRYRLA